MVKALVSFKVKMWLRQDVHVRSRFQNQYGHYAHNQGEVIIRVKTVIIVRVSPRYHFKVRIRMRIRINVKISFRVRVMVMVILRVKSWIIVKI